MSAPCPVDIIIIEPGETIGDYFFLSQFYWVGSPREAKISSLEVI